jgi:hypothetical protein
MTALEPLSHPAEQESLVSRPNARQELTEHVQYWGGTPLPEHSILQRRKLKPPWRLPENPSEDRDICRGLLLPLPHLDWRLLDVHPVGPTGNPSAGGTEAAAPNLPRKPLPPLDVCLGRWILVSPLEAFSSSGESWDPLLHRLYPGAPAAGPCPTHTSHSSHTHSYNSSTPTLTEPLCSSQGRTVFRISPEWEVTHRYNCRPQSLSQEPHLTGPPLPTTLRWNLEPTQAYGPHVLPERISKGSLYFTLDPWACRLPPLQRKFFPGVKCQCPSGCPLC